MQDAGSPPAAHAAAAGGGRCEPITASGQAVRPGFTLMCRYFPVGRGGSSRPPKQKNCTTGRSNRADSGRRRLPEETFTILAWSRQTLSPRLGAAPASVAAADISASLPEVCLPGSLVTPDQREVCPLSRQGDVALRLNPYPSHYSTAFAFSLLLYLLPRRLALRFAFPRPIGYGEGETTGLPRSADVPEWIGRISTPVARHLRRRSSVPPGLATYLLVKAYQQLVSLVLCDDAYDALPGLAIPLNPSS